jgi:hypothetical protein
LDNIAFKQLNHVNRTDFLAVVNEAALRTHLIVHPTFDESKLESWIAEKQYIDDQSGCRVQAVYVDGVLAGWCGLQPDPYGIEVALVLSQSFWGYGIPVFKQLLRWASQLGHQEVVFHLLDSRPKYRALNTLAHKVIQTEQLGRHFTTYFISVDEAH